MGSQRYLLWNDAIYGTAGYWLGLNYYLSQDCSLVANSLIWTVEYLSSILSK